ncbi:MAG: PAS domain-containing sensor histidine kinase [Syntrophobacteraceae bacterium]
MTGNRAVYEFLGMPAGANVSKTAPEKERPTHFKLFHNGMEVPREELPVQVAAKGRGVQDYELEYLLEGGSSKVTLGNSTPLFDATGQIYGAISAFIDITERKRAEEALRESRQMLDLVLNTIPLRVFWKDADLNYLGCNLAFAQDAGLLSPEEIMGKNDFDMGWADQADAYRSDDRRVMESGQPKLGYEEPQTTPDGGRIWLRTNKVPLHDSAGMIMGVLGTYDDITERKRMEEELRRSRDELEFRVRERTIELESANERLRSVSSKLIEAQENERKRLASELHDSIGQTLAALKFRIEHISSKLRVGLSEEAMELLDEFVPILQSSIDETRTIYMGLKPPILSDYGILATLEWYRRQLMAIYSKIHIELDTEISEADISEELKTAIFRIAQEALNNCCKHSEAEWVDVRLAGNNGVIELQISDDGIGMDLGFITESATAKSLGIIGMRERAELTRGEVIIKSTPGAGTTIRACWPIEG